MTHYQDNDAYRKQPKQNDTNEDSEEYPACPDIGVQTIEEAGRHNSCKDCRLVFSWAASRYRGRPHLLLTTRICNCHIHPVEKSGRSMYMTR